jgi:hypothetical protein
MVYLGRQLSASNRLINSVLKVTHSIERRFEPLKRDVRGRVPCLKQRDTLGHTVQSRGRVPMPASKTYPTTNILLIVKKLAS